MRGEADVFAADGSDKLAVHAGGPGAAERVVRRDAENESAAAVLYVDDKTGWRVLYGVWRLYVSITAVKDNGVDLLPEK
jgi:hypothetical protein